ncbi:MAG: type II toxin-antitoxin system RelE/ParE family toxin [Betaproteobacteria bacterium]|nr:type II toxin-antitoxin system RelE/ParE family toxin [Betaproteobacteria bacterium]MDE2057181.1 type II toxin-antitoxin system RelE/ParE family toxin [Betaproteobacteria bacterium]
MIKSFKHKGLKDFYEHGNKAGILPHHAKKLQLLLTALNAAKDERDINAPSWNLHLLSGNLKDYWLVTVSGNWRITFRFDEGDVELVDYQEYH